MTSPADKPSPAGSPHAMDDARCLLVLGLLRDGRPVEPRLAETARGYAAARPALSAQADELSRISDAVAALPGMSASAGFTERVLAARRREAAAPPQRLLPLVLRLSAAAAVVLAVVLVDGVRRPVDTLADPAVEHQSFDADAFRTSPYAEPDLSAGLRALMPGPLDVAPDVAAEVAQDVAADGASPADGAGVTPDQDEDQPAPLREDDGR